MGKNQPLLRRPVLWTSDVITTEGQLQSKRDEFWDTAPAFEGSRLVWDALKGAAEAAELEDYDLAQAIIDGAGISLPKGINHSVCVFYHNHVSQVPWRNVMMNWAIVTLYQVTASVDHQT